MTIWKFPLRPGEQTIKMPVDAKILCAQVQNGDPFIWVLLDENAPLVDRIIHVVGTGHPIEIKKPFYIGAVQLEHGRLVLHVFEEMGS